jgi:hypothetical protein
MKVRLCMLCGEPLPPIRWWSYIWFGPPPPQHDPRGPDGNACWILFNRRMGIYDPDPYPYDFKEPDD